MEAIAYWIGWHEYFVYSSLGYLGQDEYETKTSLRDVLKVSWFLRVSLVKSIGEALADLYSAKYSGRLR